jgi:transcriptional regulator with XRE-family HTH domain
MSQNKIFSSTEISDTDTLLELGARLARARLGSNRTQEEIAREAGVSRATIRRLEAGQSTQLTHLVRVLRALGLLPRLDALVPETPVRPLEQLERRGHRRRRASPRSSPRPRPGPWVWGEDR